MYPTEGRENVPAYPPRTFDQAYEAPYHNEVPASVPNHN
jgi:hypothetical protein